MLKTILIFLFPKTCKEIFVDGYKTGYVTCETVLKNISELDYIPEDDHIPLNMN